MSCSYKRENNPKPILPKCQYDLRCTDYTHDHRFGFYHDTFGDQHEQRMNFLLKTAKYSVSKKKKDSRKTKFKRLKTFRQLKDKMPNRFGSNSIKKFWVFLAPLRREPR